MRITKFIITATILCSLCCGLIYSNESVQGRNYIFSTESTLTLNAEPENLGTITPDGTAVTSSITISYTYNRFARPQGFPLSSRKTPTTINLTLLDKPSWCDVTLDEESFTADIGKFLRAGTVNVTTTITVKVNQDAPAFTKGAISLQANATANGNIQASSDTLKLNVIPGFVPLLEAALSNTSIILDPNEQYNVTVTVKNNGNAKMMVDVTTDNDSTSYYSLSLPSTQSIEVNEEHDFVIKIQANDDQEAEQLSVHTFTITSYAVDSQSSEEGIPLDVSMSIRTLAESAEDEDALDLTPYIIGIFAIFVIIILIALLIAWRRR